MREGLALREKGELQEALARLGSAYDLVPTPVTGFELGKTETAVIPIYIRDDLKTVMMWKSLLDDHAVYVNPFITPGVPPKQQVLRTSYMATHERKHLDHALEAFEKVGKKFGVI